MKQHTSRFLTLVNHAKEHIHEMSPQELKNQLEHHPSPTLIDVRESGELSSGIIPGALHLSKGLVERDIEKLISNPATPIVVYCSGGYRSALVALNLQAMGYTQVASLEGGLQGWVNAEFELASF